MTFVKVSRLKPPLFSVKTSPYFVEKFLPSRLKPPPLVIWAGSYPQGDNRKRGGRARRKRLGLGVILREALEGIGKIRASGFFDATFKVSLVSFR